VDAEQIANVLRELSVRGFVAPYTSAVIGANGSVMTFRYVQREHGLVAEILDQHVEDGGFAMPMNLLVVDSRGEAARATFKPESEIAYN